MTSTLTILGLYNYDTSIFESLHYPDGVDGALLINTIIYENEGLEIMYPEPTTMKFLIGLWSEKELSVWQKIFDLEMAEYNPIDNYNRKEYWKDITDEDTSVTGGGSVTTNDHNVVEEYVSGFNQTALVNSGKTDGQDIGSSTTTNNNTGTRDNTFTHDGTISGNIGIRSSQELIEQELAVRPKLNIYNYIADSFKKRFCLMVY